jgi:indole-3-glycerol phosphate synthase
MNPAIDPPDLLRTIVAATRRTVEARRAREGDAVVERRAARVVPRAADFVAALRAPGRINVIAECKRRSPSRGVLVKDYDPATLAEQYAKGGAAAISVLTEPGFFDGSMADLEAVRRRVTVPLLRKDFVVDTYQVLEARAAGADAVLLIVAALEQDTLIRLVTHARDAGLETLVEVHDEEELTRAVDAGAQTIGVNNRNLRTLVVDVEVSFRLATLFPSDVVGVSESGLGDPNDLVRLATAGYHAFLIGERFLTESDPAAAVAGLVGLSLPV